MADDDTDLETQPPSDREDSLRPQTTSPNTSSLQQQISPPSPQNPTTPNTSTTQTETKTQPLPSNDSTTSLTQSEQSDNNMTLETDAETDSSNPPQNLSEPGPEIPLDEKDILIKMETINRLNEMDSRSISGGTTGSRRSGDSEADANSQTGSFCAGTATDSPPGGNAQKDLADEEVDLWSVWGHLVKNWEAEFKKRPQYVKDLVRRGIPCHFRTIAWQLLSKATPETVHEMYAEYMRNHSPHEKVIQRDISRTYPEHEFFKDCNGRGQQALFNVMKAYSLHDREVGYCQGSAFIAGLLLLQMPEEEAFAVLMRLMEEYRLRELYKPAMTELGLCMFQLECLVQEQMPDLSMHFNNMGFDTSMYASSWFLTLFTTQLPLDLANRIMDSFISEGMEMVFRVALAILQQCRFDLLQLDMEGMLRYFQREVPETFEADHDLLMFTAYQVKLNPKKMKKLEKDYLAKRTKEQEEAVELRRLRTENRLLRQRIEYLEQESEALAERLIKGQVNLAQEAENALSVGHQLHKLRDINSDVHRRLEEAYETIRELSSKDREGVKDEEIQVDDNTMIEHIHALQTELIETNSREADNENTIKDLKQRISELEMANKRLKETPPDHCVATLQEELISVKMREAEASLSLKEMRQRLAEIEADWVSYIAKRGAQEPSDSSGEEKEKDKEKVGGWLKRVGAGVVGAGGGGGGEAVKELEDQLMGVKLREADLLGELKEMRQKVMELETQNHVCTNQIRRQDEENKRLQEENEILLKKDRERDLRMQENDHKYGDIETAMKEQSMMTRLKETEHLEAIADLKNRLAELESKSAEKWTTDQINSSLQDQSFDDGDIGDATNTRSMSTSMMSSDAVSIGSEPDFNAMIADMRVKVPTMDGSLFEAETPSSPILNGDAKNEIIDSGIGVS